AVTLQSVADGSRGLVGIDDEGHGEGVAGCEVGADEAWAYCRHLHSGPGDVAVVSSQHAGQHGCDGVAHPGEVDPDVLVEDLGVPVLRVHLLPVAGGQYGNVDGAELLVY